jgi:ubiquinone/menaquinone biosynthesis C-methylase UbiE
MEQQFVSSASSIPNIPGTGGFLNPERMVFEFGVREGMHIADFGCGAGYFSILLGKLIGENGKITAFDIMENALEAVRIKANAAGLKNVVTTRANLEVLGSTGVADKTQDAVMLHNILFQSNKKPEIIREAVRILKPGGTVVIIEWKKGTNSFGPPDELRTSETDMRKMTEAEGLKFEKEIDAGKFHFGMIFKK